MLISNFVAIPMIIIITTFMPSFVTIITITLSDLAINKIPSMFIVINIIMEMYRCAVVLFVLGP